MKLMLVKHRPHDVVRCVPIGPPASATATAAHRRTRGRHRLDVHRRLPKATAPKELYWIDGATHNDLYDKHEYVTPAVARLTEFFEINLTEAADKVAAAA